MNLYKENKKERLLVYAQHGKQTKPPAMIIEGKSKEFRFQPLKGNGLNLINHLYN